MSVVNVFAIFYVAAQVIERITELLIKITNRYDDIKAEIEIDEMRIESLKTKIDGVTDKEEKEILYNEMEDILKNKNEKDNHMMFEIFIATSILGIGIAFILGIRFLNLLGEPVNSTIDGIITGLVIGSGTKPLHDLIKYIEKAKE